MTAGSDPKAFTSLSPISLYSACSGKVSLLNDTMNLQDAQIAGMAFRCRADAALGFEYVDEGSKRVTGYNHAELVETGLITLPDLIQPAGREDVRRMIQDGINRRGTFAVPFGIFTKDRTPADGILIGKGIFSGPLELKAIEGYILRTQSDQGDSPGGGWLLPEELWQRMLDHTGDIIAYIGPDGMIRYITPSVMRILGYRVDQVTGKPFAGLLLADEQTRFEEVRQRIHTMGGGGSSARFIGMASGGMPVQILVRLFESGGTDGSAIVTISPVGEEKAVSAPVSDLYRVACEASPTPLIITRRDDRRILTVNEAFLEMTGREDPEEVTGLSLTATGLQITPDELSTIEGIIDQSRNYEGKETGIRTPVGTTPILLSARSFSADGEDAITWSLVPIPEKRNANHQVQTTGTDQIRAVCQGFRTDLQLLETILKMKGMQTAQEMKEINRQDRTFLHAISSYYQKITGSPGTERAPICAYLNAIVDHITEEYSDRLGAVTLIAHCDGDWTVGNSAGIPAGIITTELLLNSITHAFSEGEAGRIELSLTREEDWFILQVRDSGKGLPEEVTRGQPSSPGLAMVENLAMQLSGTAGFANDGGARVRIIFPDQGA